MATDNEAIARDLLRGAIDLHQHSSPCNIVRPLDHADVARQAKEAGMRAVVIKSHTMGTADRVHFVRKLVPGIDVFGSITLNYAVGGLNPFAVEAAIMHGAVKVFMPSVDSLYHQQCFGHIGGFGQELKPFYANSKGITILDEMGGVKPEVLVILDLVAESNIILSLGHLSPTEIDVLVPLAKKAGVNKLILDHPHSLAPVPIEKQKQLADAGCYINQVFFEKYALQHCGVDTEEAHYQRMVKEIREVGMDRVVLSTDLGQKGNPMPAEGLGMFVKELLDAGMTVEEVRPLVQGNPAKLVYG